MNRSIRSFLLTSTIVFAVMFSFNALAQTTTNPSASSTTASTSITNDVNLDENVQAANLGIKEPSILPNSPFYFLKNWGRAIHYFFTFSSDKKIELRSKFSNEKIIEIKELVKEGADPKTIKNAIQSYKDEIDKIEDSANKIKKNASNDPEIDKFLNKFTKQQILQEKILQKLEKQVPEDVFQKIKEAREKHLKRFGEVMTRLENRKDKITERVEKSLEDQKGSKFKNFKNLEILKNIEETVPEQAQEAIIKAEKNALKRLQGNLEKMSPKDQKRFKDYIDKISGDKEKQLNILEKIRNGLNNNSSTVENLRKARLNLIEKISNNRKNVCPIIEKPTLNFCENGKINIERDAKGCIVNFKCIKQAKINNPLNNCKSLWFYDNNHKYCQQKKFCGAYMYLGLRTFSTKEGCETSLSK